MNKANTSDKETSFLDLNIKVIGNDIHTSVYDKRDDFGFPIVKENGRSSTIYALTLHDCSNRHDHMINPIRVFTCPLGYTLSINVALLI